MICKIEGCGRKAITHGMCDMHYRREKKFGSPYSRGSREVETGDAIERFHKKYIKQEDGCWIWTGGTRPNHRGIFYGRHWNEYGKAEGSHRFSYRIYKGKIPKGMYVCHTCDTPLCVNPEHLFIGTHKDNMEDMVKKHRSYTDCGEVKGSAKLKNYEAKLIRESNKSQSCLGREYNVSQTTIGRIKRGETYNIERISKQSH